MSNNITDSKQNWQPSDPVPWLFWNCCNWMAVIICKSKARRGILYGTRQWYVTDLIVLCFFSNADAGPVFHLSDWRCIEVEIYRKKTNFGSYQNQRCSKIDVVNMTLYRGEINKDKEGKKTDISQNWLSSKITAVSSDAVSRFHCIIKFSCRWNWN